LSVTGCEYRQNMIELASDPVALDKALAGLTFLANRTPEMSDADASGAFGVVSGYRNGAIFVAHYAGNSQWERHPHGDEIVMVVEGSTRLTLLSDGVEIVHEMTAGEVLVVPCGVWHRFETPADGVKVMAVTPQPTDHQIERPES